MVRLLSFVFAAFIFSCTIIEDGDITSQEELDQLRLSTIEIEQLTNGTTTKSTARVTKDASVNISSNGVVIKRQLYMDWPALGSNSKLKIKSGVTTAFRSYVSFLESGKPHTFYLFSSGPDSTLLEHYRFVYNTNGKLASVITRVPYVADGFATSRDTLIYNSNGNLSSITRKYPATSTSVSFTNLSFNSAGSLQFLSIYTFQGMRYTRNCNDPSCGGTWGGNYNVLPTPSGFPKGVMNLSFDEKAYLSIEDFNHLDQSICNGNPCPGWIDTFYLHPLMILSDQFEIGEDLLFIYMVDWWQTSAQESAINEKTTFTFKYEFL